MGELDLAPPDPPSESVYGGPLRAPRSRLEIAGWAILLALLTATFLGALTFDRSKLPQWSDEATYALQAASLARDFDLAYGREDFERFVEAWGAPPEALILQSRSAANAAQSRTALVYGKPPLYALATAPFVRLAPVRGGVVANAFFLAGAALLAARTLRQKVGGVAPLWVAVFLFASLAFAQVFWGEVDLFLLAATASGFALVYARPEPRRSGDADSPGTFFEGEEAERFSRVGWRFLAAGALLALPVVYRPVYAALWLPALFAAFGAPRGRRVPALAGLAVGGLALAALSAALQFGASGDWTGYGGDRRILVGSAVTRAVDLDRGTWAAEPELPRTASASWFEEERAAPGWNLDLLRWNGLYAFAGRNLGLLPYFLPLLLGFTAWGGDRGRWALPLAALAVLGSFLVLRPFDFLGGGPYGDRYFLALYPALWFVAARPGKLLPAVLVALGSAPFLYLLWLHPRAYPIDAAAGLRHVTPIAKRLLPFETTQASLPGGQAAAEGGLLVRFLDARAWGTSQGRLRLAGDEWVDLLIATPQPLAALHLELGPSAPSRLETGEKVLRPLLLKPDGGLVFALPLGSPVAVHPAPWSRHAHSYYRLRFRLPGAPAVPLGFRLRPAHALIEPVSIRRSR